MLHWARYTIGYSFDVALSREVVMACNSCETNFQGSQTLVVSVAKSGSRAVLSVGNQGRNIVLIRRILLCVSFPGGGGTAVRAHAKKIKLADVTKYDVFYWRKFASLAESGSKQLNADVRFWPLGGHGRVHRTCPLSGVKRT
jgi:hypothetical protein